MVEGRFKLIDLLIVFSVVSAIMVIGFLGNLFFKKTGWPEVLFLIIAGILLGPVFNIVTSASLLPITPVLSTFTLLMILFRGGMELKLFTVFTSGLRAMIHASAFFAFGMAGVAVFLHYLAGWEWIDSLMLGSILSQTGSVVVVPMVQRLSVKTETKAMLPLEATLSGIFNIVFFFALLETRLGGILDIRDALSAVAAKFSVGVLVGVVWLRILFHLRREDFTYMITLAYILLGYVFSETLGGSGDLAVLAFGVVLGNDEEIFHMFRMSLNSSALSEVKVFLTRFQNEISFLMRTFFFVLLSLIYDVSQSSLLLGLSYSLPLTCILLLLRYPITSISTWRSPMASDKRTIVFMCALGLTPALLSIIPLQYNLPNAHAYPLIVTNTIILTNVITSISALKRQQI